MKNKYMTKGFVFLVLSIVGLMIPIIPQVPFFLLAMTYFSKGNQRFHRWLTDRKLYRFLEKLMKGEVKKSRYAVVK